jgi:hypothetical protein
MSKYFDKDFFKFFMGFVAILSTSIIILLASRLYQEQSLVGGDEQAGAVVKSIKK